MLVRGLAAEAGAHIPTPRGSTKWRDEATEVSSQGGVSAGWMGRQGLFLGLSRATLGGERNLLGLDRALLRS